MKSYIAVLRIHSRSSKSLEQVMRNATKWFSSFIASMVILGTVKVAHGLKSIPSVILLSRNVNRLHRKNSSSLKGSHLSGDIMDTLMERVRENNDISIIDSFEKSFIPFMLDSVTYGYISHSFAELLKRFPDTFQVTSGANNSGSLQLVPDVVKMNLLDRSAAVGRVTEELKKQKIITGRIRFREEFCNDS